MANKSSKLVLSGEATPRIQKLLAPPFRLTSAQLVTLMCGRMGASTDRRLLFWATILAQVVLVRAMDGGGGAVGEGAALAAGEGSQYSHYGPWPPTMAEAFGGRRGGGGQVAGTWHPPSA